MPGHVASLAGERYDLVVVGGGIHGLFAAYDAASRGLKVALLERRDYGSGLSFNHQRTIHGGLRALETGQVRRARAQLGERRTWAHIAPHLMRPLPFLVATYRWTKRSRTLVRAGFAAYDVIGRRRNRGVTPELHLPACRLESVTTTRRLFPGVREAGLTGGAIWYDYQVRHPDRLNWLVALAATGAGARLVNYAEVTGPLREGPAIAGVRVRDVVDGAEYDVQGTVTLIAAGAGLGPLLARFGAAGAPPLLRAMNVLVDRPARDLAVAAAGPTGRMLTAVPWRGRQLVGTHQSSGVVAAEADTVPPGAVEEFLGEINAAFPRLEVRPADLCLVHHGLTPAVLRAGRPELLSEPVLTDHRTQGAPRLVSLAGVKLTTARQAAARAVDLVCRQLGRSASCRTATRPLPHADVSDVEGRLTEQLRDHALALDRDVFEHLTSWYGTEAPAVVEFAAAANLLDRVADGSSILAGEIAYAAARSDAPRLADVVLRRTPLGSAGHPGVAALDRAARIMGDVRQWSEADRRREIAEVESAYPAVRSR